MKDGCWMRVLFCKIHCPFICFWKPSHPPAAAAAAAAAHLYTSAPLKLESSPHVVHSTFAVSEEVAQKSQTTVLKSCIRKPGDEEAADGKRRVRWVDNIGKQLAEIKEFESSETGDSTDSEEDSNRCLCIIL